MKHFLSLLDCSKEDIAGMIDMGLEIARSKYNFLKPLKGRTIGIYFSKLSTRTRTSFSVGALKMGASIVSYAPGDLQTSTGESFSDTGRILSEYLDALVIRTNGPIEEMKQLACQGMMPVINAMSDNEHPSQVIGDLITIKEVFSRLNDIHILYLGEGNNTASTLALAIAMTPSMKLSIFTPTGYGLSEEFLRNADVLAKKHGSIIEQKHDLTKLPGNVDVVYTTRWQTMGVKHNEVEGEDSWRNRFFPYQVNETLMEQVSYKNTIFMHDLPAVRGEDVTSEVLDGTRSLAFRQAKHKMTSAIAILGWCLEVV